MTSTEAAAYRAGVQTMIDLATATAEALRSRLTERPTRYNFAIGALEALVDEGRLILEAAQAPAIETPGAAGH